MMHASRPWAARTSLRHQSAIALALALLAFIVLVAIAAPWLGTVDPRVIDPAGRNQAPALTAVAGVHHWMGTDSLGRDVYSRTLFGARVSLVIGASVALGAMSLGLALGLLAGYVRAADAIVMRCMDGLMAIPAVLLALTVVSLTGAGILAVIIAIVIPEVPRVVRLVRAVVLTVRAEPYVEAAVAVGTPPLQLMWWHIMPATLAPLAVQGTYVAASAILIEAILSFLGVGIAPETPTWGNIMAEGRALFRLFPHNILFPGAFLAVTVLAVNLLGDGLAGILDPRVRQAL